MAINLDELRARPLDPEIAEEITRFEAARRRVPRRRPRRGRLPGLPPEPGHLRPAPGRHQPDGAGEGPLRPGRRPSSSRCSRRSPTSTRAAGATSPPARTCSSTSSSSRDTPEVLRLLASVGLTSREACGDTVRNVAGCHLAGACPYEVLDISPWAEAAYRWFLRNPLAQRLPRKFKINFSRLRDRLRPGDVQRRRRDRGDPAACRRHHRARLPGVPRRRSRRQPAPGAGARGVHEPRGPARHDRGDAAHVRPLRQPRQQAAGPHEVARRHDGHRRAARAHHQGAQVPARVGHVPGRRARRSSRTRATRRPAWAPRSSPTAACRSSSRGLDPYRTLGARQRRARPRQRHRVGVRALQARRHHHRPVPPARRDPARPRRRGPDHQPPELRAPRPHRGAAARRCTPASSRPTCTGRAPSSPATSSPARAPTPATSRSRSRAASPTTSAARSTRPASPRSAASASTSPAAPTRAASTTSPTSASWASSGAPTAGPRPATRCCSAAPSARWRSSSARRPPSCRPRPRPQAVVRVVDALRRRAVGGRDLPRVARPLRRRGRGRHHAQGPRRLPDARREPRLLRRLRRDRSLRLGRSERASARRDDHDARRHHARAAARSRSRTSTSWPRSRAGSSTGPRRRSSRGPTTASATTSCSRRRSRTAC